MLSVFLGRTLGETEHKPNRTHDPQSVALSPARVGTVRLRLNLYRSPAIGVRTLDTSLMPTRAEVVLVVTVIPTATAPPFTQGHRK